MIPRYELPEMASVFTDRARFVAWLEVEILALEGWAAIGRISSEDAAAVRQRAPEIDSEFVAAVGERETVTNHDLAAFVDVLQSRIDHPSARWLHYGLTSSDVVDTALATVLKRAGELLVSASSGLVSILKARALEHMSTPIAGRTHGMFAEPTTFGAKLALFCLQADRDRHRLQRAVSTIAAGKLSGAVGTYSNIDPRVEAYVCKRLGLVAVPASQVVARDRHADLVLAAAQAATTVEAIATEVRLLSASEVGEVSEHFAAGAKGSSAMPHKRNPILSERLCGIARMLRGYAVPALENVALWHERDISHSSVERIVLADALQLAYYSLVKCMELVAGLDVHSERMLENLTSGSSQLVFSQSLLLAMIEAGTERDKAYRIVQRDSVAALGDGRCLSEVAAKDPDVRLAPDELARVFSLERVLANVGRFAEALEEVEG